MTWYEPVYQIYLANYSSLSSKSQIPTKITNPILCTVPHLVIPSLTENYIFDQFIVSRNRFA
jgi:hypothetical protein